MWKQIKPVDERETTRIANVSQNWCSKAFYILFTFLFNFSLFVALLHQMTTSDEMFQALLKEWCQSIKN